MLITKSPLVRVLGGLVLTTGLTFLSYGAFATWNWHRLTWLRDIANSIRSVQDSAAAGRHVQLDELQASYYVLTTSEDSTYQRILAECPSVGPLRFGVSWDSITGEKLSTWEMVLARSIWLWCALLVAGAVGFGMRWAMDRSFKRAVCERAFLGEAISASSVGTAGAMLLSPFLSLALWHAFYDRTQSVRPTMGTFWPSQTEEIIGLATLAILAALIAAWQYPRYAARFWIAHGEHCVKCGYPLPCGASCPECGPEVGHPRGLLVHNGPANGLAASHSS